MRNSFKAEHPNFTALKPQNSLVLRQHIFSEHGIPERRSITHRSEAKGKKKMLLYAHDWLCKVRMNNFKMQVVFELTNLISYSEGFKPVVMDG